MSCSSSSFIASCTRWGISIAMRVIASETSAEVTVFMLVVSVARRCSTMSLLLR